MASCVYIVTLRKTVLDNKRFLKGNKRYVAGKPCVYVGSTGKDPEERFLEHLFGVRAGRRYVTRFGKGLRYTDMDRRKLTGLDPRTAKLRESQVAEELRLLGWGVWQA